MKNVMRSNRITAGVFRLSLLVFIVFSLMVFFIDNGNQDENIHQVVEGKNTLQKVNTPIRVNVNVKNDSDEYDNAISFYSVYQTVKVSYKGNVFYERKKESKLPIGKATPSGWNYVEIPHGLKGDMVTVELSSPYVFSSGRIPTIYTGSEHDLVQKDYEQSMKFLFLDTIILALGIFWIINYFYMKKTALLDHRDYAEGLLAGIIAIWLHYGTGYQLSIFFNDAVLCYFAQVLFLMIPIAYTFVLYKNSTTHYQRYFLRLFKIAVLNFFICQLLQIGRIVDIVELISIVYGIIGIGIVFSVLEYSYHYRRKDKIVDPIDIYATGILMLSGVIECVRTFLLNPNNIGMVIRIGMIVYVVMIEFKMMQEVKQKETIALEVDNKLKDAKLKLLTGQIQPHFIYNTLGNIQALIRPDPEKADELIYMFSQYLRENVNLLDAPELIPFQNELNHIQTYVEIEKVRFEERVQVVYDITERDFFVPALSIQPLVENAIKHGICKKDIGGTVWVCTYRKKEDIFIEIKDNGVGFDVNKVLSPDYQSVGLKNSKYRLEELAKAKVTIGSDVEKGTRVLIQIPNCL